MPRCSCARAGGCDTDWCDDYLACRLCNVYLRLTSRAHYKTYRQAECVSLLEQAGHAHATVERYKISWLWGLTATRAQARTRLTRSRSRIRAGPQGS